MKGSTGLATRRDVLKGLAAGGLLAATPIASARQAQPGRSAVVVGAGIAGLSAAWELRRAGFDVAIFEKRDWSGGRMREAWMGPLYGFTHAAGVLGANREMFSLAEELGIADELRGPSGPSPVESEWGSYDHTARWRQEDLAKVPGLSADTIKRLPALQADLDRIRHEVGLDRLAKPGDSIRAGDMLCRIHAESEADADAATLRLRLAWRLQTEGGVGPNR